MLYRLLLFLLLLPLPAQAAFSGNEKEHAKSAFQFADRGKWRDAISHAKKSGDDVLVKLMTWQSLLDSDSGASFEEITHFIAANPDWPDQKKLRVRAEQAIYKNRISDDTLRSWFEKEPPLTGAGKIALAKALGSDAKERVEALVKEAWKDGDFEEDQEKDIVREFGSLLSEADHIARADRLLWDERTAAAKRLLPRLPKDYQRLAGARIGLIQGKRSAVFDSGNMPTALKDDPGLMYNRIQYRARRGDNAGVRELLLKAPANAPYPEKWWKFREMQIRLAIDEHNYGLAEHLLKDHEQLQGSDLADATWIAGWLQLEFQKNPKAAYETFYRMYDNVRYPISRARAAFWAARAAEASSDTGTAENWYATASAWPTAFYGQIGAFRRYGEAPLKIPAPLEISESTRKHFKETELAHAVNLCLDFSAKNLANKLIAFMVDAADNEEKAALAADLGIRAGYLYLGVRGAKKALQKSVVLTESGYPIPDMPEKLPIERALALAIARQESEFDAHAVSPSKALGLMQLLPRTAKEMARKIGASFQKTRLFDSEYNIRLGSHYLARLIKSYDGSYVMAIAAYNAGPGNVRKWTRQFGTPGDDPDGAINWIEKIPFAETRNYVQRVLENLQVYRHLDAKGDAPKLGMGKDLVR